MEEALLNEQHRDEASIREARAGCTSAFGRLLDGCQRYLTVIASQDLPEPLRAKVDPADVVQDTLFEAFRDFSHFHGRRMDELLAWLRQILINNISNLNRHYELTKKRQVSRERPLGIEEAHGGLLRCGQPSPSSLVSAKEQHQNLDDCLNRLSDDMKAAIILRNREQLSFAEIGIKLGRSAGAARKLWARAIECLQQQLVDELPRCKVSCSPDSENELSV